MRAWIQSSLFGVPLPDRILPSLSRTSSVLALARPGLRCVGMKKVSVPGMRALACPNALERPKRSTMRLASATSRLSVRSAPRRLLALLMLRFVPQGEHGFGDDRRVLFAPGELVDRSPGGKRALEPLHRADFSENPGAAVDLLRREDHPREFVVARLVGEGPVADLHRLRRGLAAHRGGRLRRKLAQPVSVERAEPPGAHAMQREKRETRNPQEVFLGLRPRRIIHPARPAGDNAALQPVRPAVHRGGEPPPLLAVGLESRLFVQREYGGGRPVARGELFLLHAPEQGPPPVRALRREEKLELALVGRDPVLREGPQPPRCDAEVIRMLPLRKPAPAGALGSGHGAEILLDQFDVDPARVARIVFPEREENLGGGPGFAGELSFPVQATVERSGKLFRFFADGPARFIRKRHDPVRSEYHAAIAPGHFRKNRREADPEHGDGNECRHTELAPVALTNPGFDGFESLRRARAHLAYLNDTPMQAAPDGIDRFHGVQAQLVDVGTQPVYVGLQLFDIETHFVDVGTQPAGVGPHRLRVRAELLRGRARFAGLHGFQIPMRSLPTVPPLS